MNLRKRMVNRLKKKVEKKKQRVGNIVLSDRKCPFCTAINSAERKKCRKCHLEMLQYPDVVNTGTGKEFSLFLKDPRSSIMKLGDYLEIFAFVVPGILFVYERLYRREIKDLPWESIAVGVVWILSIGLYYVSTSLRIERMCMNCGKVMVLKVPIRTNAFPKAVKCWACDALHKIQWDFQKLDESE